MPTRPAVRADISTIRQRFTELDRQPDLDELIANPNVVSAWDKTHGAFGLAVYSPDATISGITYLLPEGMSVGVLAPLLLDLLNGLWAIPAARLHDVEARFTHGLDPVTGKEDYGKSKMKAWQRMVSGNGRLSTTSNMEPIYGTSGNLIGYRGWWKLSTVRNRMKELLRGA